MKRNPFYKTLQALALLLLALATMASAATGLDTDPDTQELYVNMPVSGTNTVEITAADIAGGLTTFKVYDDGGKSGDYSNDAFGHLSLIVPTGYGVLISGTVETEVDFDKLTIYNEAVSGSLSLNDENRLFISDEVVSVTFESNGSNANSGFALKVSVVKHSIVYVVDVDGGIVRSDKYKWIAGETVTLTIVPEGARYELGSLNVMDASNNSVAVEISGNTATFTMPTSDVTVTPTWNKLYGVSSSWKWGGKVTTDKDYFAFGETVTLTIVPTNGFKLENLEVKYDDDSGNSVAVEISGNTATFTMPASDVRVYPTWFELKQVNVENVDGGEVTPDKDFAMPGETVTLTISPADGYVFGSLKVEDASHNAVAAEISGNTATFTMPASNVWVYPTWDKLYNVTIANTTDGEVNADEAIVAEGRAATLTISPAEDYMLANLEVKDENQNVVKVSMTASSFSKTASFVMPSANVTVTPSWTKIRSAEGGLFINMPISGEQNITIPDGVTSFNVYDDGGKDGDHSWTADGYLTITVPKDYVLQLTGKAKTRSGGNDRGILSVFDGNSTATPLLSDFKQVFGDGDIGSIVSTGNVMTLYFKSTGTYTAPGLELKATLVRRGFGAVAITKAGDGKFRATIDGTYTGTETLSIPDEIEVDEVDYDRELEVGVPVTAMLPVALPEGASVNADFYTLKKVEQVDDRWQATMTYIGDGKLPQPNTPYAFILKEGETKLEFNLNGKKATVQTGPIQNVCGLDKDCVLDDKGNITDDWFFTGTYAYKVWNGADEEHGIEQHPELGLAYAFAATDNPGGAAKGKFGRIVAGAYANPMRCYLRKRDASVKLVKAQQVAAASYVARYSVNYVPETIDVEFVKDDAKGGRTVLHGRMNTVTGEFKMHRDFDLKGRKVNSANRARGAYYGKKVLKK
jgi:hypothetical protein